MYALLFMAAPLYAAPAPTDAPAALAAAPGGGGGGKGDGKNSGKNSGKNNKKKEPYWDGDFYWQPSAGATVYSSGDGGTRSAFFLGAQAGYKYTYKNTPDPKWSGRTRVSGNYILPTGGLSGIDLHLGSFIGPSWNNLVGVQFGPDLFWNQLITDEPNTELEPTTGLEFPVSASLKLDPLTLSAGVAPAWVSNEARRVDWDDPMYDDALPGFGHEFSYHVGAGIGLGGFNVSVGYSYRITAGGVQQGFSAGARL